MFHATETPHRFEARAASGATREILGASFEDAALEFVDLVHEGEVADLAVHAPQAGRELGGDGEDEIREHHRNVLDLLVADLRDVAGGFRAHQRAAVHMFVEEADFAEEIARVTKDWVPLAYAAFEDYRMGGVTLSGKAIAVLKRRLAGEVVEQAESGMSKGEWREFVEVWG